MDISRQQKLFGVGPVGAAISFVWLAIAYWLSHTLGYLAILANPAPLKIVGAVLVIMGLGLHFWSMWTLRNWWNKDKLCTTGPFRWFRHPMYAAWITFVLPGFAFFLNSWIILIFVILLHPIWLLLVIREEKMILDKFQDEYRAYAAHTGRYFPRIWHF